MLLCGFGVLAGCGGGGNGSGGGNTNPPPAAPAISYGTHTFEFNAQTPITLTPTNNGGAVATWSISAGLPAGLTFDTSTGAITGMAAGPLAPANVTVTATNAGGSSTWTLNIGVQSVLLTLGALNVGAMAISDSRVLVIEGPYGRQHWILWDYVSGSVVAQGDGCPPSSTLMPGFSECGTDAVAVQNVALAGTIAVVPYTPGAIQILSAATGKVVSTIKGGFFRFQVAPDGSYVCTVDMNAISAWPTDGNTTAIVSHAGNYLSAKESCGVGEMRIANGPAGTSVIERIAVPGGQATITTPFAGTFNSWSTDGSAFLTSVGNTAWVYSPSGALLDTRTLATTARLGGTSQWFWTFDNANLNVYKVGASATPTAVYPVAPNAVSSFFAASGHFLTMWDTAVHMIDLNGTSPVETDYPTTPLFTGLFAAVSAQKWVIGSGSGAVLDGSTVADATPRFFSYGSIQALAGSPARLAAATASGETLIYDTSNWSLVATIRRGLFAKMQLSADGSVLATLGSQNVFGSLESLVQTISLPADTVINTWSYNWDVGPTFAGDITLSSSGKLLGQVINGVGHVPSSRQVTAVTGGPVLWSDSDVSTSPIFLSNDDTLIAVSSGSNTPHTNVYLNYQPSTPLPGTPVAWLPNNNILQKTDSGDVVYTLAAAPLAGPPLPALSGPIQVVTTDSIYDGSSNAIYSLSTGAKTWSGLAFSGVLAGSRIAYVSGNQLVTEPY